MSALRATSDSTDCATGGAGGVAGVGGEGRGGAQLGVAGGGSERSQRHGRRRRVLPELEAVDSDEMRLGAQSGEAKEVLEAGRRALEVGEEVGIHKEKKGVSSEGVNETVRYRASELLQVFKKARWTGDERRGGEKVG